jgi:hypothetical protein
MIYVAVLVACKLFLREDELEDIHINQTNEQTLGMKWELCVVNDRQEVDGLLVCIKGKTDRQPVYLMLWADHDTPFLCPVRHLLVFIHLAGNFHFINRNSGWIYFSK